MEAYFTHDDLPFWERLHRVNTQLAGSGTARRARIDWLSGRAIVMGGQGIWPGAGAMECVSGYVPVLAALCRVMIPQAQ